MHQDFRFSQLTLKAKLLSTGLPDMVIVTSLNTC